MKREIRVRLSREKGLGRLKVDRESSGRRVLHVPEGVPEEAAAQFLAGYGVGLPEPADRTTAQTGTLLAGLLPAYSARLGLTEVPAVRLCPLKGLWGRCRMRSGLIELNETCRTLPDRVVEALLVHELCHMRVPDHGPAFWRLMTEVMPDWAYQEGMLRRGYR